MTSKIWDKQVKKRQGRWHPCWQSGELGEHWKNISGGGGMKNERCMTFSFERWNSFYTLVQNVNSINLRPKLIHLSKFNACLQRIVLPRVGCGYCLTQLDNFQHYQLLTGLLLRSKLPATDWVTVKVKITSYWLGYLLLRSKLPATDWVTVNVDITSYWLGAGGTKFLATDWVKEELNS